MFCLRHNCLWLYPKPFNDMVLEGLTWDLNACTGCDREVNIENRFYGFGEIK